MSLYDPIARFYEADMGSFADDVPFYSEMARRTGGPVLVGMCGSGRLLLPLAQQGYALTGVDVSAAMLAIARAKLQAAGLHQVELLQDDLRRVALPAQHFAFACVPINSFMHLERVKDQLAALARLRQCLHPDGLLVLDVMNPNPAHLADEDNRLTLEADYQLDGRRVLRLVASESDVAEQTSLMSYIYDELGPDGGVTRHMIRFRLRWLYRYELEHLLHRAGFALRSVYGSYDLDAYTSQSERLLAVAAVRR